MRIALDTNVLLYAEGVNGPDKQGKVRQVLGRAHAHAEFQVSTQACAEFFRALTRKFGWERSSSHAAVAGWQGAARSQALGVAGFNDALGLASTHQFQIFDAMILASAIEGGCALLLSEDMQHGFSWRGTTIVNPFTQPHHPALLSAMTPP